MKWGKINWRKAYLELRYQVLVYEQKVNELVPQDPCWGPQWLWSDRHRTNVSLCVQENWKSIHRLYQGWCRPLTSRRMDRQVCLACPVTHWGWWQNGTNKAIQIRNGNGMIPPGINLPRWTTVNNINSNENNFCLYSKAFYSIIAVLNNLQLWRRIPLVV